MAGMYAAGTHMAGIHVEETMTKDILLTISGLHPTEPGEEPEPIELITPGAYYKKKDKHYICYEETGEDPKITTKNMIKISPSSLEIIKKGPVSTHMVFERGKKNVDYYRTPFGDILIGIDTKYIEVTEQEAEIDVRVKYDLEMNQEHMANSDIKLVITDRGNVHLQ